MIMQKKNQIKLEENLKEKLIKKLNNQKLIDQIKKYNN